MGLGPGSTPDSKGAKNMPLVMVMVLVSSGLPRGSSRSSPGPGPVQSMVGCKTGVFVVLLACQITPGSSPFFARHCETSGL